MPGLLSSCRPAAPPRCPRLHSTAAIPCPPLCHALAGNCSFFVSSYVIHARLSVAWSALTLPLIAAIMVSAPAGHSPSRCGAHTAQDCWFPTTPGFRPRGGTPAPTQISWGPTMCAGMSASPDVKEPLAKLHGLLAMLQ